MKPRTPTMFIGSAKETEKILDDLSETLGDYRRSDGEPLVEVKTWLMPDTFKLGEYTLEALERAVHEADFAAFILGRSDKTESRKKFGPSPRDNVVFEAGMFAGGLGLKRTYFLVDSRGTKLPTDWEGIGWETYVLDGRTRTDRIGKAARAVANRIESEWAIENKRGRGRILGDWWQYVISVTGIDDDSAISLFSVAPDEGGIRIHGRSVTQHGEWRARYESQTARFDTERGQLSYYWTGEHPKVGLDKYFGAGVVSLGSPQNPHTTVNGEFSVTQRKRPAESSVKFCIYERADPKEAALYRSRQDSANRKALMKRLITRLRKHRESNTN